MSEKSKELRLESEKRRSYRNFMSESIERETIEDWIMTANTAPSGANKQPWYFCVVTDAQVKMNIREAAEKIEESFYKEKISDEWREDLKVLKTNWSKPFLTQAPCLIVIFRENYKLNQEGVKEKNYYVNESVGLATGFLINAIRHSGYKSLTYTPAPMSFLREMFNRPVGETPVMILAVGKADKSYQLPDIKRKSIGEIATFY